MQSKSLVVNQKSSEKTKHNKSFDFLRFYKPVGESNVKFTEIQKSDNNHNQFKNPHNTTEIPSKRNPKKNNKVQNVSMDITTINIDGNSLLQSSGRSSPMNDSKVTSMPKLGAKKSGKRVQSIMKNSPTKDESFSIATADSTSTTKSKKRNKSVSFMLDANEEVVVKRSKSNDVIIKNKNADRDEITSEKKYIKKQKLKLKQRKQAEKENEVHIANVKVDDDTSDGKHKSKKIAANIKKEPVNSLDVPIVENQVNIESKKKRQFKKAKSMNNADVEPRKHEPSEDISEQHVNKAKKKKRHAKNNQESNDKEVESEPAIKTRKKNSKPDLETGIENLNIGDNAHTLTDLIDKMTVADKKKKKLKKKKDKIQQKKSLVGNELTEEETPIEEKEKVKWSKRRWNKDKKHVGKETRLVTSVVVENLPLDIMADHKKLLAEHFAKCGVVHHVGVAELYPSEDPKPVFTTTIFFESEDAASQALEEDNTVLGGARVRVRRPLAPALTTLVVRSHAALADHALSSAFAGAGRLRSIRHAAKGKKSMSTAFIEFDGPEAVERALKLTEDSRIGGKKMYASKYELRLTKKQES